MDDINTIKGDMRDYPVQSEPCLTCPFEGREPFKPSRENLKRYMENLVEGHGQHICHSSNNTRICRGGRNIQLKVFCVKGLLPEPTDEAFNKAVNEAMNKAKQKS